MKTKLEPVAVVAIVLLCAAGFASSMSPTVDGWLSTAATWLLVGGGSLLAGVALLREGWQQLQDWQAFGPPDLGPWRRRRSEPEQEPQR